MRLKLALVTAFFAFLTAIIVLITEGVKLLQALPAQTPKIVVVTATPLPQVVQSVPTSVVIIVTATASPTTSSPIVSSRNTPLSTAQLLATPSSTAIATSTRIPTTVPIPTRTSTATLIPVPTLPSGKPVSAQALAEDIGGDARYWRQDGYLVWAYWNKDHNATFRHPGNNVTITYWWGFSPPTNVPSDCIVEQIDFNGPTRSVRCMTAGATFSADGVGLHLPPSSPN